MKFAQYIEAHTIPEWRAYYFAYRDAKKVLSTVCGAAGVDEEDDDDAPGVAGGQSEGTPLLSAGTSVAPFFQFLEDEKRKIEAFMHDQVYLVEARLVTVQKQARHLTSMLTARTSNLNVALSGAGGHGANVALPNIQHEDAKNKGRSVWKRVSTFVRHMARGEIDADNATKQLKLAFVDLHNRMEQLQKFQLDNYNAFLKITKKFDKLTGQDKRQVYMDHVAETAPLLCNHVHIKDLMEEVETSFQLNFAGNDSKRSGNWKDVRVATDFRTYNMAWLRVGVCLGLLVQVLVRATLDIYHDKFEDYYPHWKDMLIMFRGLLIPILAIWFFAVNTYVWKRFSINHVFVFEFDPHRHLSYHQVCPLARRACELS